VITDFHGRPLVATPPPMDPKPAPRPTRDQALQQFVVLCGNDNFFQWVIQETVSGRCPL
jgi:hypothetical protein